MSVVNYFVDMTINEVQITGGFAVDYSDNTLVDIDISTTSGLFFTNPTLAGLAGNSTTGFQLQAADAASTGFFPYPNDLFIGFSDANQDGDNVSIGPEMSYLSGSGAYGNYPSDTATIAETPTMYCFLLGTRIETAMGSVAVEKLKIGDKVLSHSGREVEVKWIGWQKTHSAFAAMMDGLPICISAGALGNGLPSRNLYVSPDHAMYLDDCMLVHAKALVNGLTIYQVTEWEGDVTYLHIETENHEIIFAEGAPTETFIDNVSRKAFYNHSEYEALYPNANPMVELDIPRVKYARQVPKAMLAKLEFCSRVKMRAS